MPRWPLLAETLLYCRKTAAPASAAEAEPIFEQGPTPLRRYCRCGCGAGCATDADCGPGGRCVAFVSCC